MENITLLLRKAMSQYHNPVLLHDSVDALEIREDGTYVDVTFGGGGHSSEILNRLGPDGRLLAFDQDPDCLKDKIQDERFQFIPSNFRNLKKFLQYYKAWPVNGILADLGVSSYQLDTPGRGFSYRYDGSLDMRMNPGKGITAFDVVNQYTENKLTEIFYSYGELSQARRVARKIIEFRQEKQIATTFELVDVVTPLFPANKVNKSLSQLFQAIRIEVNGELEVLKEFLLQTPEALAPQGRLVIISYHSLEDRLVKNFLRSGNFTGEVEKDFFGNPITPFQLISRKALLSGEEEIRENSRARSAKLRIAEKR